MSANGERLGLTQHDARAIEGEYHVAPQTRFALVTLASALVVAVLATVIALWRAHEAHEATGILRARVLSMESRLEAMSQQQVELRQALARVEMRLGALVEARAATINAAPGREDSTPREEIAGHDSLSSSTLIRVLSEEEIPRWLAPPLDAVHRVAGELPSEEIIFITYDKPLEGTARARAERVLTLYSERMLEQELYYLEQLEAQAPRAPNFATYDEAIAARQVYESPTDFTILRRGERYYLIDVAEFFRMPSTQRLTDLLRAARAQVTDLGVHQVDLPVFSGDAFLLGLQR